MRVTLADPTLARQAGRFVWLELNFDAPANRDFLVARGVAYTPALFVLDPRSERATASHMGGMSLPALIQFLDQGAGGATSPADSALAQGDASAGLGRLDEAAAGYRLALRCAPPGWRRRGYALGQLKWALMIVRDSRACAELAVAEAPRLPHDPDFARVVLAGLTGANGGGPAAWAADARRVLVPLAAAAVDAPYVTRDNRFELYQGLMHAAELSDDPATRSRWGGRWLDELDVTVPTNDDERTALDVARVDAVSELGSPERALAALTASERAMPRSYNASLRLAQVEIMARRFDEALAACARGLARVDGPIGRTWLLETEAEAWMGKGDGAAARRALTDAARAARDINTRSNREHNLQRIARMEEEAGRMTKGRKQDGP
jgi:tetratricopeptide (TPR) repeat protein